MQSELKNLRIRRAITPVDGAFDCAILNQDGQIIAECFGRSGEDKFHNAAEAATLFAAAPELLEALSFYVTICGNTAYSTSRESAMEAYALAQKAFAKVKGGTPCTTTIP